MSREGVCAVCASHAKAALFASGFVRKPRQSSTMPAFSFLPDVKNSFFSSQLFSVSSGFSLLLCVSFSALCSVPFEGRLGGLFLLCFFKKELAF